MGAWSTLWLRACYLASICCPTQLCEAPPVVPELVVLGIAAGDVPQKAQLCIQQLLVVWQQGLEALPAPVPGAVVGLVDADRLGKAAAVSRWRRAVDCLRSLSERICCHRGLCRRGGTADLLSELERSQAAFLVFKDSVEVRKSLSVLRGVQDANHWHGRRLCPANLEALPTCTLAERNPSDFHDFRHRLS